MKVDFHVAVDGDDNNPGTLEKPFARITRARDAIRELKTAGKFTGPVNVMVRGGTYRLFDLHSCLTSHS